MQCSNCKKTLPDEALFCCFCGEKINPTCSNCGHELLPDANFCFKCGAAVGAAKPNAPEIPTELPPNTQFIPREVAEKDYKMPKDDGNLHLHLNKLIKQSTEHVIVEEGTETIGAYLFHCCQNLKSVKLPESLKEIRTGAFYCSKSLETVKIPDSVTTIGSSIFAYSGLKIFTWPSSMNVITERAFDQCLISEIEIPPNIEIIESNALSTKNIKHLVIPSTVKDILLGNGGDSLETLELHCENVGYGAFSWINSLKKIVIHPEVKKIGQLAFERCSNLEYLDILSDLNLGMDWLYQSKRKLKQVKLSQDFFDNHGTGAFICEGKLPEIVII